MRGDYDKATDYEALIYIQTASLANPLSSRWFHIFANLFKQFYPDKSDFLSEHDCHIDKLCDEPALKDLKDWIFRKQREHFKKSARILKQKPKANLLDFMQKKEMTVKPKPLRSPL